MEKTLLLLRVAIAVALISNANGQSACTTGDVRLVDGSTNREGRVEVCSDGSWGTVCDDRWTEADANVVCGQLGHSREGAIARTGAYFGQGSGGILLDDIDCSGFEDRLVDCDHRGIGIHDCNHYEDAGVTCQRGLNVTFVKSDFRNINTSIEAIRLVNGFSTNMGRLEVLYNGTWGTVCDDFWSYQDAKVACSMMGYDDAVCAVTTNFFGIASNSVPYWMDNLLCVGYEEALDKCSFAGWGNNNCRHAYDDAGIVCANHSEVGIPYDIQMANSTTRSISLSWRVPRLPEALQRVQFVVSYTSQFSLGTSTSFTAQRSDGSIVREGDRVTFTIGSLERNTDYSIKIATNVRYLPCSTYYSGNYSETVTFRTSNTTKTSNISVRLVSPYSGVDFLGRVEVFHDNQWGTVCDDYFSTPEAHVICGMLNFSRAECVVRYARYGRGSGPIWLGNLDCSSDDEIIEDCNNDGWGITYCSHSEDVGVVCRPNNFPPVQNVMVTSVGANSVTVSWTRYTSFPNRASSTQFDLYYGYSVSSRRSVTLSGSATAYTLSGLQFDREYSIRVRPKVQYRYCGYIYGAYSNEVTVTTIESAPTGPPSLFHIQAINESAIEAQWSLPRTTERNGIIRGYKLFVLTNGRPDMVINITTNATNVYIIGNLEPRRAYTVSVLAYTVADGPKSIHLTAVTRQQNRSLITGFGINGNGLDKVTRSLYSSRIYVHCSTSLTTNVTVEWQFVNGSRIGTVSGSNNVREQRYNNGTNVLVIGYWRSLTYCEGGMYTCVVNTTSGRREKRTFHLVIGSSPPRPSRPTVLRQSGNKVTIGWLQSSCYGGHVPSSFRIRYRRTYYSSSYITITDPMQRSYEVTGLSYSQNYYFYIRVTTTDSRTSSESSSARVTTLRTPPSAPRTVTVSLISSLLARVRWTAPSYSGGISQYTVLATPISVPDRRKRKRQATADIIEKVFPGNVTSADIALTHHSITYTFQVSAAARSGSTLNEGDPSSVTATSILFVPEPGLPKPLGVQIVDSETTNASLTLSWGYPPPPSDPIRNFFITYSADVEWRSLRGNLIQFEDSGEMTVNGTRVTLSPLVPGTTYVVKVSAISSRGRGEEVMVLGNVRFSQDKLAFFQLRLSPIVNCHSFLSQGENITEKLLMFRRAIVTEIFHMCPTCSFTTSNIRDDEFSCRGGLTNHIVYRAMIIGTNVYSPTALLLLIQSWVRSGTAAITIQHTRLYLDQDCGIFLDTLRDPDCPLVTETPPTTTTPTPQPPETVKITTASATTTDVRIASEPASNQIGALDISGFVVAVIIIALISVILVMIIFLAFKWNARKKKNAYSVVNEPLSATVSIDQINKECTNVSEDHKEEYTL